MLKRFFLLTLIFLSVLGFSQNKLSIIYTGNMGVLITDQESSVLIDGLHTKYGEDYLFPTSSLLRKITNQLQPDAILFTHYHGDHFSAPLAKEYLVHNKKAVLFGSSQVTEAIENNKDRLFTIATDNYIKQTIKIPNLKITGVKINHAGKRHSSVENVGYIVDFNTYRILHVGDTNWMEEISLFNQLDLHKEQIDIAVLPYWMLLENNAPKLIKKYIHPKYVIATHISPRIQQHQLQDMKKKYPDIHFLTKLEEQIQL